MKKTALLLVLFLCLGAFCEEVNIDYPFEKFSAMIEEYNPEGYYLMGCDNDEEGYAAVYMKGFENIFTISLIPDSDFDIDEAAKAFTLNKQKAYYIEEESEEAMIGILFVHYPKNKMYCVLMEAPLVNGETKERLIAHFEQLKF